MNANVRSDLRFTCLYLRTRHGGTAALVALAIAVFIGGMLWRFDGNVAHVTVRLLPPVLLAAVVALGAASPFGETERIAGRPLLVWRAVHLGGLTALAFGLLLIADRSPPDSMFPFAPGYTFDGILWRNFAAYLGLALLCAWRLGVTFAWLPALAWALAALVSGPDHAWTLPIHSGDELIAWTVALGLLIVGLVAIIPRGARDDGGG